MTPTVAALTFISRSARTAGLRDPAAPSLAALEQRRTQLWATAFAVMTALAIGTAFLSNAVTSFAEGELAIPAAARVGVVPLVAGLLLYVVEKERALRRLTRAIVGAEPALDESSAVRDPLTGLLDRDAFSARLADALAAGGGRGPLAVLLVDLDRLPQIATRYGQSAGDHVLREVARRVRNATRAGDRVARLGAHEIGVLAEAVHDTSAASELARRVVAALRDPVTASGHQLITTCSVGVVVRRARGRELPEDVLRDAGLARNLARVKGPNRWELFDQSSPPD